MHTFVEVVESIYFRSMPYSIVGPTFSFQPVNLLGTCFSRDRGKCDNSERKSRDEVLALEKLATSAVFKNRIFCFWVKALPTELTPNGANLFAFKPMMVKVFEKRYT